MKRLHRPILRAGAGGYGFIRSLNPAAWYRADTGVTVTGLGASTWADQSGNGRDLLQGTDANRPPYLSYSGTKYLYLPGVAGNYAITPDSAANSITGDIDIRVRVALNDWTPSAPNVLAAKYAFVGNFCFIFRVVNVTGALQLLWSEDGTTTKTKTSSAAPTISDGATLWVRVTLDVNNGAGDSEVKFYTAADSETEPTSWTQLGTTQTVGATTSIFDSNSQLEFGTRNIGGTEPLTGKLYRAILKNGIDGTTVVDFNPDLDGSDQAATITSSATGEVWTINKSGGLPAQIVARPSLLFDGTADYLKANAFTLNQPETVYIVFKQVSWTDLDVVYDGNSSVSMYLYQSATTPNIRVFAGSALAGNGGLAVGTYGVHAGVYNGASSVSQVNLGTPVTGNAGAANAGGLTLGANATPGGYSNIQVLEILCFASAHDATQRARVIQYCVGRHGIAL